jgi:HAD superfamily hydrolase (TIGR01509 family)
LRYLPSADILVGPLMIEPVLIFDCDDTLVESELLCKRALEQLLVPLGVAENAEALMRYRGEKLDVCLTDLQARHQLLLPDSFVPRYRALVLEMMERELKAVPGVDAALARLPFAKCVASGGPVAKMQQALRVTGLARHFSGKTYSSYEIQSWKPAPDLFLHAARQMNADPSTCLVIEDSLVGVEAATRAGMDVLLYDPADAFCMLTSRFRSMDELPARVETWVRAR